MADEFYQPVTAILVKEIDTYTALVNSCELDEIISKFDLEQFFLKKQPKAQKAQIERIMKGKIEEIKMLEQLEKYAGKNSEYSQLLSKYKECDI